MHRAITIMKSPVAGHVVQPFTIKEAGVATVEDLEATRELEMHDFTIHDALLSDLALAELPSVDPACTLRSTQQSTAEDPDETQLDGSSGEETQLDEASDQEEEEEGARATSESSSFDLVSDSNEEEDDPFYRKVTEE
ncbi:hypothetical protein BBJ28_00025609 [Nothophytophthora sp. Chile5]|nr:hypothetical protein BBJ28_00025609 [Nothophytophthora sp. Chile5]